MNIFNKFTVFLLVATIIFVDFPASLIDEWLEESNIVDQAYLARKSASIVDNFNINSAQAADGSGTNIVSPNSVSSGTAGNTFDFTFTAAEVMDSGSINISVPAGWSAPQGLAGTAGYTTAVSALGMVGNILTNADTLTGVGGSWVEDDTDACNVGAPQLRADTATKKEGTGSILCDNTGSNAPDDTDSFAFRYSAAANWSSYTKLAAWVHVTKAMTATNYIQLAYDDTSGMTSPLQTLSLNTLAANTWTYVTLNLTAARTAVREFGIICKGAGCDSDIVRVDYVLIGPGQPNFTGSGPWNINVPLINLNNSQTVTVSYGSGGGSSGVIAPTVETDTPYTFTTDSRTSASGALTDITTSPIIIVTAPSNSPPSLFISQPDGISDNVTAGSPYDINYSLIDIDNEVTSAFYYDADGSGLNGFAISGACAIAAESPGTTCSWDTSGVAPGTYYIYGIVNDGINPQVNVYSSGMVTISAGPDINNYTNTEAALDYANCATGDCGGRISQTITLTGANLGASVVNKDNCTSGSSNGCVRIGNYTVPAANVSSWTNTQIIFTVPSGINVFGGSGTSCGASGAGLCLTQNGVNASSGALQFWIFPDITSVSPGSSGEGKEGDSVVITGNKFDTLQGTVVFQNCAVSDVTASIGSWNNTSISVIVPNGIDDNDDACDIKVNRAAGTGSKADTSTNFKVLPEVIAVDVCADCNVNADREYDNGINTYGIVQLSGKHFGIAGTATILGSSAVQHTKVEGACANASYSSTSVCYQVPNVSDSLYVGDIILTRTADSKNSSISGFRILPKISSIAPSSGSINDPVVINGDHLCQAGSCPSVFDVNNKVIFNNNISATVLAGTWSHTSIPTQIPNGAVDGDAKVSSNGIYFSNGYNFSVLSPVPSDPENLSQWKDAALSQTLVDAASSSPAYLSFTMKADLTGGTLYPQIEYQIPSIAYNCSASGFCASATEGLGKAGPGPINCSQAVNGCAVAISPPDNVYRWRARVRHNKSGVDYYSGWVNFGVNDIFSGADLNLDTASPLISFSGSGNCSDAVVSGSLKSNGASISWNLNESGTGQIEYSKNSSLSSSQFFPPLPNPTNFSHSLDLVNLDSNTTYYFKVRSMDAVGNVSSKPINSPFCSFTTNIVNQPAKTVKYYVAGMTNVISGGIMATSSFLVNVPESDISIKSAFIELTGVSAGNGINNIQVKINAQPVKTYVINSNETSVKILYNVNPDNINLDPLTNLLSVTPDLNLNSVSAKIFLTYAYAP